MIWHKRQKRIGPDRERERERESHLWSMRKSNHLSIKLLANIALRPRYEEISLSFVSQEGCQNSPRYTKENCQMIDYRIVYPSISILCYSLFYSLRCVANSGSYFLLYTRRVKRWFVGLLPVMLGKTYCKKNEGKRRRKGKRMLGSLVPKCGTNVLLFHCILVPCWQTYNRIRNPSIPFSLTPCGCLLQAFFSPYSHSILAVKRFSDFLRAHKWTLGFFYFLCDSLLSSLSLKSFVAPVLLHVCLFLFASLLLYI